MIRYMHMTEDKWWQRSTDKFQSLIANHKFEVSALTQSQITSTTVFSTTSI